MGYKETKNNNGLPKVGQKYQLKTNGDVIEVIVDYVNETDGRVSFQHANCPGYRILSRNKWEGNLTECE